MPKKDINQAVLGMLSSAGSATRPVRAPRAEQEKPAADPVPAPAPAVGEKQPTPPFVDEVPAEDFQPAPESQPELESVEPAEPPRPLSARPQRLAPTAEVPRTLRLRPAAAQALREAWIEAKHEDVMLTAQDFASELIEEMLKIRRRRESRAAS